MGSIQETKAAIFVPKEEERVLPFGANGHSGTFEWDDDSQAYTLKLNVKRNGEIMPHWKLGKKLQEHIQRQETSNGSLAQSADVFVERPPKKP